MKPRYLATGILMTLTLLKTGSADGQTIESLVMPGEVIEGHAEVETECSACHETFNRDAQRGLCMECHEDVGLDIEQLRGYHGLFEDARVNACSDCHTDHEGRDARIVDLDEDSFDHDFTDYPLIGGHVDAACDDCHEPGEKHRNAPSDCVSCHLEDEPHEGFTGTQWTDCHSESACP